MSSSASTSTAGSNAANAAAAAAAAGQQSGEQGGNGAGPATGGAEGNIVEKQPNGAGQGSHPGTEPQASSPAPHRQGGGPGGTTNTTGTAVLRRKTNVCLICGIYTNLSLNIFEPRNGPNIVDVIYEKYKFRAERGDNADKHICFSCNNWLINWYSLQNTSSGTSRTYEPAPSTSRSSSAAAADSSNNSRNGGRRQHTHKPPRTKAPTHRATMPSSTTTPSNDKENYRPQKRATSNQPDQHGQISSTTSSSPTDENWNRSHHPYSKKLVSSARRSLALKENNGQRVAAPENGWNQRSSHRKKQSESENVVSSSTEEGFDPYRILVKPFESRLIQMLRGQGTSVTKEHAAPNATGPWVPRSIDGANGNSVTQRTITDTNGNVTSEARQGREQPGDEDSSKEIVISFDTTLSEVIDVVPSLKAIQCWYGDGGTSSGSDDPVLSLHQRLSSGSLTVSLVDGEANRSSAYD